MTLLSHIVPATRPQALTMAERLELEFNDADNAARLLAVHGNDLVYVMGKGWAVWDGCRYSFRFGPVGAREIGHRLREIVLEEARAALAEFDVPDWQIEREIAEAARRRPPKEHSIDSARAHLRREKSKALKAHATKCGNVAKVETALKAAEHQRKALVEDMDRDPWVMVLPNGQLDLRAVSAWERPEAAEPEEVIAAQASWLGPVDRARNPTRCAGVPFKPGAACPKWEAFVELIMPNPEIRACLQRCLGATLFGENEAQVALILRGPGGNGKSTLLNAYSHVMGRQDGYAAACKIEMFLETGTASPGAATPEEADMPGARAYIATEPGARDVLSAKKIKGLTGGDRRMSRGLFADPFFWTPHGVPILSCNRTPKIKDEDEGTRRRLVFLPFDVNLRALPPEKQRPQGEVEAELRAEGPGILNWLIDGYRDFKRQGIAMPEPMRRLKDQLLEAADPVGVFLSEMCEVVQKGRVSVTDFYAVYERWCEEEGRTLYQSKTVGDIMVEKGFERFKTMGRSHWRDLDWSADAAGMVEAVTGQRPASAPRPADPPAF